MAKIQDFKKIIDNWPCNWPAKQEFGKITGGPVADPSRVVSWWIWEILDKYPALLVFRYYSEGAGAGCVFVHKLHGEVTTAQVDTPTV